MDIYIYHFFNLQITGKYLRVYYRHNNIRFHIWKNTMKIRYDSFPRHEKSARKGTIIARPPRMYVQQPPIDRFAFPLSAPISRQRSDSKRPFLCSHRTEFRLRSYIPPLSLSRGSRAWGGPDQRAQTGKIRRTNTSS